MLAIEAERAGRDAGDFRVAESGRDGQAVAERSDEAGHLTIFGAVMGGYDQAAEFFHPEGPAVMASARPFR